MRRSRRAAPLAAALFALMIATPRAGFAVPISGTSVDLSDPQLLFLEYDLDDDFTIDFTTSWVDFPFNGTVGQRFHLDANLTLDVPAEIEDDYQGGLIVFTSIRVNGTSPLD